jgi:signal transduction histidine kinase
MRDVKVWIRGSAASRQESVQLPPGQAVLGAVLHNITAEQVPPGVQVGMRSTERPIGNVDASIDDLDDKRATAVLFIGSAVDPHAASAQPASEDGLVIVDAESGKVLDTVLFAQTNTSPRVDGEILNNTHSRAHPGTIDSGVQTNTAYLLSEARQIIEELVSTNRRKDEFLAILGHELRSPLASIDNGIHLLSHAAQDASSPKTKAVIARQVRSMTRLLDDLLDVSRITQGRLRLQCERIDLRDVVSDAIETLESDIKQRNHRLAIASPDTPVWLHADPGRLEQVLVNLLANASKYTDAGGELAVGVHVQGCEAVVRVRDSGIGIAPEVLPHMFDLFKQADTGTTRSRSGLGIGLALVRYLVELHGGSVTGASAGPGQGSEFTVCLTTTP